MCFYDFVAQFIYTAYNNNNNKHSSLQLLTHLKHTQSVIFYELTFDMTTIIRVKYVEYLSNSDDAETASVEREMLVNLNCPIRTILDYIRKIACINSTREFDLCDEVNCQLKNVSFYEPLTRGTDILQPDLTYFIITFERDDKGQMINLTPLLTEKTAKSCCDILSKMQRPL